MNKLNLLSKLTSIAIASIGAITVSQIAVKPAQAGVFAGNLGFTDNTNDFFFGPDEIPGGFSVTFNPTGVANNNISTGDFDPIFTPFNAYDTDTVVGNFTLTGGNGTLANPFTAVLNNSIVFDFPNNSGGGANPNDNNQTAGLTIAAGSQFAGEYDFGTAGEIEGLDFEIILDNGSTASIDSDTKDLSTLIFEFGDTPEDVGGLYLADGGVPQQVPIPEPASILGILAAGGLGLGLKRKKQ